MSKANFSNPSILHILTENLVLIFEIPETESIQLNCTSGRLHIQQIFEGRNQPDNLTVKRKFFLILIGDDLTSLQSGLFQRLDQ